jgi:hypothetical protein
MKTLPARLKALFDVKLFVRVCMVVWGTPFVALALLAAVELHPSDWTEWALLALAVALGAYGAFLLWLGFLGSDSRVENSIDLMSEGGELLGVVFAVLVAVIAVPVTLLIRMVLKR